MPTHGKRDRYDLLDDGTPTRARKGVGGTVTTHAKGEGAIEGSAEDYRMKGPSETDFRFSRFGVNATRPPRRAVSR